MKLHLEPEGPELILFPGHQVQVHVFDSNPAFTMKQFVDDGGTIHVSFWPEIGTYELYLNGINIWDLPR